MKRASEYGLQFCGGRETVNMRRPFPLLCSAIAIAFGIASFAKQPASQPPPVTGQAAEPSTGSRHMKTKATTTNGTVKANEPGKSVEVTTKAGDQKYDMTATDMTVTVSPDIKVGSKVKVVQKADSNGRKTVSIEAHGSGTH